MIERQAAGEIARRCAVVLCCSLGLAAVWLWVRLLQGKLVQPLTLPQMLSAAATATAAAAGARAGWFSSAHRAPAWQDWLVRWGLAFALAAVAIALTLPGTPAQPLLVLWGLAIAEEVAMARWIASRVGGASAQSHLPPAAQRHDGDMDPLPDQATQRLTRSRRGASDVLSGSLRARFAPRQRSEALHVAFCPPFARAPALECRQLAGPAVRIKATQVLPHGARLELKLDTAADETAEVIVGFSAAAGG